MGLCLYIHQSISIWIVNNLTIIISTGCLGRSANWAKLDQFYKKNRFNHITSVLRELTGCKRYSIPQIKKGPLFNDIRQIWPKIDTQSRKNGCVTYTLTPSVHKVGAPSPPPSCVNYGRSLRTNLVWYLMCIQFPFEGIWCCRTVPHCENCDKM